MTKEFNSWNVVFLICVPFLMFSCTKLDPGLVNQMDLQIHSEMLEIKGLKEKKARKKIIEFGSFKTLPFSITNPDSFSFLLHGESPYPIKATCTLEKSEVDEWMFNEGDFQTLYEGKVFSYLIELEYMRFKGKIDFYPEREPTLYFDDLRVTIRADEVRDTTIYSRFYGYYFEIGNEVVAAVDTESDLVWIDSRLNERSQLVVASLITAIVLQPENSKFKREK